MKLRRPAAILVVAFDASGPVGTVQAASGSDGAALLARYGCEVVERLRRIHETPDPADEQDRFLILARADAPQDDVQCAFTDGDRRAWPPSSRATARRTTSSRSSTSGRRPTSNGSRH